MPGELTEAHKKLQADCSNCHTSFSKKSQRKQCLDCHKEVAVDVKEKTGFHGKRAEIQTKECKFCHTEHIGRKADIVLFDADTFDHKLTDFVIDGAHVKAECAQCHKPKKKFSEAPSACIDCHKDAEPHEGKLGKDCASCHTTTDWVKTTTYDHSKTNFPLKDNHQKVPCKSCHIGEVYKDLPTNCIDCHRIQDVHEGRFGEKCETCHAPSKWTEVKFDHNKDTKFPLAGKHAKAKCDTCHEDNAFKVKLETDCVACHKKDDPHEGQLGKNCSQCHSAESWRDNVVFDHEITRFPLIGLHALVPCEACHVTSAYRDAPLKCATCHEKDDYHEKRLGKECATCHNPNGWDRWVFNHNRQTKFKLTGSHEGLECRACHTKKRSASLNLPTTCISCHKRDDVHRGSFGKKCESCHVTGTFKDVKLRK